VRLLVLLVVVIAAVIFAVQNAAVVTINLFFWHINSSLAVVIALCFAIGGIAGVLFVMPRLYRMRSNQRQLRAQLADLGVTEVARAGPPRGARAEASTREAP